MATKAPKAAKAAKPPAERTIKSFFKLLEQGDADKVKAQLAKLGPHLEGSLYDGYPKKPAIVAAAGSRAKNVEIVRMLLDAGADITAVDTHQRTALHAACDAKAADIVKLLVERGASLTATDKSGARPYALADTVEVREVLRASGDPGFGPRGGKQLTPKVHANAKNMEISRGALGFDADGNVWFVGYSGVFRYDGKVMTRFAFEESMAFQAVGAGPPGVVYFGTNWGLLELKNETWTLFRSEDSELFDNHITDLRAAPDGRVYMMAYESEREDKHIVVFDGTTFTTLAAGRDFPGGIERMCLLFDQRGKLAIGGDEALATQRDDGTWHVEKEFDEAAWSPCVYDAIVEGERQWVATSHGLLVRKDGKYTKVELANAPKTVCKDGDAVWIGFRGGIGKLVGDQLTVIAKEDSELPDDDVINIARNPKDGRIWIHAGGGAAYIENGEIVRFD